MAVNLVSNPDGTASAFGDFNVALSRWLEGPYGVIVFGMFE